jgi:hypothetical protein
MGYLMVTVHRAYGFRFVIFPNDHSPPHVHVFGQGGEATIVLEGPGGIELDWAVGVLVVWSHFLRRTAAHFAGKCSSAAICAG